jgi:hypothetical protein
MLWGILRGKMALLQPRASAESTVERCVYGKVRTSWGCLVQAETGVTTISFAAQRTVVMLSSEMRNRNAPHEKTPPSSSVKHLCSIAPWLDELP